jgi:hypothetical protein
MRMKTIAPLAAALASLANLAWAGTIDPAKPAVCAMIETFECVPDENCIADTPEGINLPRFIKIDFAANKAYGEHASGEERSADILTQKVDAGRIILQGIQNGNGWTAMIDQATGNMSLSIAGSQVGFVIYGACTQM